MGQQPPFQEKCCDRGGWVLSLGQVQQCGALLAMQMGPQVLAGAVDLWVLARQPKDDQWGKNFQLGLQGVKESPEDAAVAAAQGAETFLGGG